MRQYTNPLNNIRIASPCSANWSEMYGNERKRFCGDCKLNVYNLSDMTRHDAENLLLTSEGRLCVRFFRRSDGTVLTKNCPVGWQAVKQRASRVVTAAFSVVAGLFGGVFAFSFFETQIAPTTGQIAVEQSPIIMGDIAPQYPANNNEIQGRFEKGEMTLGMPVMPVRRVSKHK